MTYSQYEEPYELFDDCPSTGKGGKIKARQERLDKEREDKSDTTTYCPQISTKESLLD